MLIELIESGFAEDGIYVNEISWELNLLECHLLVLTV
jgi:hypothetical protein